jgi:hypothetical protein
MIRHGITLGDIATRIETLEIRCCERHGRLSVAAAG